MNERMRMNSYLALGIAISAGIVGQICLKTGAVKTAENIFQPFLFIGLSCYFFSSMFYIYALRKIPLSIAYPTVAISYVIVAYLSHLLWGELFGPRQMISLCLIVSGIACLYL
jgi:small multidrug resistance pump